MCARQASAELHFQRSDGELVVARVRLMALNDTGLIADRPVYVDGGSKIPVGREIAVHVTVRGKRCEFPSRIESEFRRAPSGSHLTGPGVVLRRPESIASSQRRSSVRVSVAGCDPIRVVSTTPFPGAYAACSLMGPIYHSWMVDISAGGLSMVMDRDSARSIQRGGELFLTFCLPDIEGDFNMLGRVRHMREVAQGESVRLALAFRSWQNGSLRSDQQRIARFVAARERTMLKRRR